MGLCRYVILLSLARCGQLVRPDGVAIELDMRESRSSQKAPPSNTSRAKDARDVSQAISGQLPQQFYPKANEYQRGKYLEELDRKKQVYKEFIAGSDVKHLSFIEVPAGNAWTARWRLSTQAGRTCFDPYFADYVDSTRPRLCPTPFEFAAAGAQQRFDAHREAYCDDAELREMLEKLNAIAELAPSPKDYLATLSEKAEKKNQLCSKGAFILKRHDYADADIFDTDMELLASRLMLFFPKMENQGWKDYVREVIEEFCAVQPTQTEIQGCFSVIPHKARCFLTDAQSIRATNFFASSDTRVWREGQEPSETCECLGLPVRKGRRQRHPDCPKAK